MSLPLIKVQVLCYYVTTHKDDDHKDHSYFIPSVSLPFSYLNYKSSHWGKTNFFGPLLKSGSNSEHCIFVLFWNQNLDFMRENSNFIKSQSGQKLNFCPSVILSGFSGPPETYFFFRLKQEGLFWQQNLHTLLSSSRCINRKRNFEILRQLSKTSFAVIPRANHASYCQVIIECNQESMNWTLR